VIVKESLRCALAIAAGCRSQAAIVGAPMALPRLARIALKGLPAAAARWLAVARDRTARGIPRATPLPATERELRA
jgi:hypothetical protein